jgi:hypothetical protein
VFIRKMDRRLSSMGFVGPNLRGKRALVGLLVVAGGLILIMAASFAALYLLWGWGYTDEEWPQGRTIGIRTIVEDIAPLPDEAEFVNVHRYGGGWDVSYRECVYYHTDMKLAEILGYYSQVLDREGFRRWRAAPDYAGENYFTLTPGEIARPAGLSIDFGSPTPHHKKPHSYAVCSASFERVAEVLEKR